MTGSLTAHPDGFDPNRPLAVSRSVEQQILGLAIMIALFGGGLYLGLSDAQDIRLGPVGVAAGWASSLIGAFGMLAALNDLASATKKPILLTADGFTDLRFRNAPVPWSHVSDVYESRRWRCICLHLEPGGSAGEGLSLRQRWANVMFLNFDSDVMCLSAHGVALKHASLFEAIRVYWLKYAGRQRDGLSEATP